MFPRCVVEGALWRWGSISDWAGVVLWFYDRFGRAGGVVKSWWSLGVGRLGVATEVDESAG